MTTATAARTPQNNRFNERKQYCSARALYVLVHFFAVRSKRQREMTKFKVCGEHEHTTVNFFILLTYLNAIDISLVPNTSVTLWTLIDLE